MALISIKEYKDEYKKSVVDLIIDIQQNEYNMQITRDEQPDLGKISEVYQSNNGNFWLAFDNKDVVGTVALLDIGCNQGALKKMYVKKQYRGSEYRTAQLLWQNLLEWAEQKGIKEIFLGTTEEFLAAHRFYEKNGFNRIDVKDLPDNFPTHMAQCVDTRFYKYNCHGNE